MAIDPVCGMQVDPEQAADHSQYMGRTYYFCSTACAEKFEQDPQRYAGQTSGGVPKNPPQVA